MLSLVIYTGFAIPTTDMHVYFRWINYINPIGYAFESLMINEFHNRQFPYSQFVPEGPGYGNISNSERVCSMVGSIPGSNFVDGGMQFFPSMDGYRFRVDAIDLQTSAT